MCYKLTTEIFPKDLKERDKTCRFREPCEDLYGANEGESYIECHGKGKCQKYEDFLSL